MEHFEIFEDSAWKLLLPFTYTRSIADIRIGILTIREKWEKSLGASAYIKTRTEIQSRYEAGNAPLKINASWIPDTEDVERVKALKEGESLVCGEDVLAVCGESTQVKHSLDTARLLRQPWEIFGMNGECLKLDFELLTKGRKSAVLSETNQVKNPENIFLEEGAKVEFAILNASSGPIYIGKDAEIMEGCIVRGPLAMGNNAVLKLGAKVYGPTTLGPFVKAGGEINNSVVFGYSNKGHDGFLGNSVIGEWCNLGADTNNSNLKNNYGEVKIWSYDRESQQPTGLQFCGLMMGDYSRCGINTMFNTGTVVGVNANVFGGGFPPKFIPSFSWGGADGMDTYDFEKACKDNEKVFLRRSKTFGEIERSINLDVFEKSKKYRTWEM